jgi:hypothetical protein
VAGPRLTEEGFNRKHGKRALSRLRVLLQERSLTYAQIGSKIGLSKQRVSQLAQQFRIDGRRRLRERANSRFPTILNNRANYTFRTRLLLRELERRGISVAPHYAVDRRRHSAKKLLTTVLLNGVPCKVRYQKGDKIDPAFAQFEVKPSVIKAKALVLGVRRRSKFRLYVIPAAKLKNIKQINIPVNGEYKWTWRWPKRDWTRFENAWHLLG